MPRSGGRQNRSDSDLRQRRSQQLETVKSVIDRLENQARIWQVAAQKRGVLASHLDGFYEEIDKLTKGKSLIPVTDLIVERINDIIRDAKELVSRDTYLERVKEFVPAGDNPVYPDVLMTTRTVKESLERFKEYVEVERLALAESIVEAKTIQVALELYLDGDDTPLKDQIQGYLDEKLPYEWFSLADDEETEYFDFERLDRCDIERHFSQHEASLT